MKLPLEIHLVIFGYTWKQDQYCLALTPKFLLVVATMKPAGIHCAGTYRTRYTLACTGIVSMLQVIQPRDARGTASKRTILFSHCCRSGTKSKAHYKRIRSDYPPVTEHPDLAEYDGHAFDWLVGAVSRYLACWCVRNMSGASWLCMIHYRGD